MEIKKRISYLSKISLDFDYDKYLKKENKKLIVFKIDNEQEKYSILEGNNVDNILEQSNAKYFYSEAGYLFDISSRLVTDENADLVLISNSVLGCNQNDIDTILIHELVHLKIDSNTYNEIIISPEANDIGQSIYKLTDVYNDYLTRHTEDFCKLLSQACISYNRETSNFFSNIDAVKSAMRYDIFE